MRCGARTYLAVERKIVKHVSKSLGVHQPVFNRHVQQFLRDLFQNAVERIAHPSVVGIDFFQARPVGGFVLWQATRIGIDSEREQPVELGMETGNVERASADQVPIKGLQMPHVEDHAVALWNWTLIQRIRPHPGKQGIRA